MKKIGNWIGVFLLMASLLIGLGSPSPAHALAFLLRYYVKPGGLASGVCDSWANACNLQYAFAASHADSTHDYEFWLKQGTYKPGSLRSDTFTLKNRVSLYGGFAGTETLFNQRNPAAHATILSGDIGTPGVLIDNSFHVVNGGGVDGTSILDGVSVVSGDANDAYPNNLGGGMYNSSSSPTLTNVTFSGNAAEDGGGMSNISSNPTLTNVTFNDNYADFGAGMANTLNSSPTLMNATFTGNSATTSGGGMDNDLGSNPILFNVTFAGNFATQAPEMFNYLSTVHIYDSIFWKDGSEFINNSSSLFIDDSLIAGGCPSGATCTRVIHSNPLLGPLANNGGFTKTMALAAGSPAIDAGEDFTCAPKDQHGVPRTQGPHCDMGAYEARYMTFRSNGSQDGWILESGENTNVGGGTPNSTSLTLTLGDTANRRQYRTVLSFNTSSLPDNAILTSVLLRLKRSTVTPPATNPISLLQGIMLDLKKGFLGSSSALQATDFQAAASKTVGPFSPALTGGFYRINLPGSSFSRVNKLSTNGGLTQFRVRFKLDDNNNSIANTLNLVSGNNATASSRPTLMIVYNTP